MSTLTVQIQSFLEPAVLSFSELEFHDDSRFDSLVVTLKRGGLEASGKVDAFGFERVVELFSDIAESWKGWKGEKSAQLHNFGLACTSDGLGHAHVKAVLSSGFGGADWKAEVVLVLEIAQCAQFARELKNLCALNQ